MKENAITVSVKVASPIEKVWEYFNEPTHIMAWSHATADWHTPHAENDLRIGGKFLMRMAAKDGSTSFDFIGTYTKVDLKSEIHYIMSDGREVVILFKKDGDTTMVTEIFDPESENPLDMQRDGWQAILNNFKAYTEST